MRLTRRSLLQGAVAIPVASMLPPFALAAASAKPVAILISGVSSDVDLGALSRTLNAVLGSGLSATLTFDPLDREGNALDPDGDFVKWLRDRQARHSDRLELGIHVAQIAGSDIFGHVRQASDAQAAFLRIANVYKAYETKAIVMGRTMTTRSPAPENDDFAAMRAAGIRSVIHLPVAGADGIAGGWRTASTGLRHIGAVPASSALAEVDDARWVVTGSIAGEAKSPAPLIVDIGFDGAAPGGNEAVAASVAQVYGEMARARTIAASLVGGLDGKASRRLVVVRVDDLRLSPETDVDHMAFVRELIAAGYPVTDAVIPAPDGWLMDDDEDAVAYLKSMRSDARFGTATHGWQHTESELAGGSFQTDARLVRMGAHALFASTGVMPLTYVPPNNAFDDNTLDALATTGIPAFSADKFDFRYCQGLDHRGIVHISNTVMFEKSWDNGCPYISNEELTEFLGDKNDAVFMIHPQTADTPGKRKQIMDALASLSQQEGTTLVNFDEYRQAVLPPMPAVNRIQEIRRKVWIADAREAGLGDEERAALMQDAALAWRYFQWGSSKFNGLAPGTAAREGGEIQGYPFVTMWDVASQILAAISANRLGLIGQGDFEASAARLVAFLGEKAFDYQGVQLPPTERSIGKKPSSLHGFDSADTGRLLIALKTLDRHVNGRLPIEPLVRSWGLEKTLIGGELHDIDRDGATSAHSNSYAPYASRGFALWGYEVKPIFDAEDPMNDMGDALRTMATLEDRGRIATEPLVTEEIELGASPHARLASDILYAAQIERYEKTGKITCASESALATAPYFTYQGYQLNGSEGDFVVDEPSLESRQQTARQQDRFRVVNAKGAYLWHATRPGAYSDALIGLIRGKARLDDLGFASGVHEKSGKAVALSEINTNGIILEAIAYMLNGRKPLL